MSAVDSGEAARPAPQDEAHIRGLELGPWLERTERLGARLAGIPQEAGIAAGAAVILGAMAILAASPTLFVADAWPDIFLGLDAALHWAHGHRPHVDFHTPLGAAYVALMGLAGRAADFGPHTPIWANIGVAAFTALVLGFVTVRRLNAPLAALTGVYWTLFALSPRRLGGMVEHVAFLAAYDKWGFALVAGLWLAVAVPPRRGGKRAALAEALILGAALTFLFYLKVTFFAAGLAPFLFRGLLYDRGDKLRRTLKPVVICIGMIALAAFAGGISLIGYANDILMAAHANTGTDDVRHLRFDVWINSGLIALNVGACLYHYRVFKDAAPEIAVRASQCRALFLTLLILAFAVNNENTSAVIPLLAVLPLVLVAVPQQARSSLARAMRIGLMLVPATYFLWWSVVELRAIVHHNEMATAAAGISFCTRTDIPICNMRVTDTNPGNPEYDLTYAETEPVYEELYAVLDPLVTPQSRIVQFGFFNMLDARYRLEPARGGLLFWHYGRSFNDKARPRAKDVFADATLVVMARVPVPNSIDRDMNRIYGPYVREHFTLAAETKHWQVYRRP